MMNNAVTSRRFVQINYIEVIDAITQMMNVISDMLGIPFISSQYRMIPTSIGSKLHAIKKVSGGYFKVEGKVVGNVRTVILSGQIEGSGQYAKNISVPFSLEFPFTSIANFNEETVKSKINFFNNTLHKKPILDEDGLPSTDYYFEPEERRQFAESIFFSIFSVLSGKLPTYIMTFDLKNTGSLEDLNADHVVDNN